MAVPKPVWIEKRIAVNRSVGALAPQALVMHVMQGTLAGCDSWFADPRAQASANFGVGKDGAIHCYVDPESHEWAWANGLINGPSAAVQALLAANAGTDANQWTIAIEHEGMSGQPLTPQQLAASAGLAAYLLERYAIPFDEEHILGHYEFDRVTRAGCPGWDRAGWVAYEQAVQAVRDRYAPPPPPGPDTVEALRQLGLAAAAAETQQAAITAAAAALGG